jgi:YbbR domain-containing protein
MTDDETRKGEDSGQKTSDSDFPRMSQFTSTAELPASLRKKLKKAGFFYRLFIENISLKILSLLVAFIMFALVKKDTDKEVQIEVPVVLSEIDDDQIFVGEVPKYLEARIKGRWSKLIKILELKPNPYLVNLHGIKNGSRYNFSSESIANLTGVSGVQILSFSPSGFQISLEAKVIKRLPVNTVIIGQLPNGYKVDHSNIVISPQEVTIWGARNTLKDLKEISTDPIDISGMDKEFHAEVSLKKPPGQFAFLENEKVKVKIPVMAPVKEFLMKSLPVSIKNCRSGMECAAIPEEYNVKLIGPEPVVNKFKKEDMENIIYLDAEAISDKAGFYPKLPPIIDEIENIQIKIWPRAFSLKVTPSSGARKSE